MDLKQHEEILKKYKDNRELLLKDITAKLEEPGEPTKISKLLNVDISYISRIKANKTYVSYEQLIEIAKKIL